MSIFGIITIAILAIAIIVLVASLIYKKSDAKQFDQFVEEYGQDDLRYSAALQRHKRNQKTALIVAVMAGIFAAAAAIALVTLLVTRVAFASSGNEGNDGNNTTTSTTTTTDAGTSYQEARTEATFHFVETVNSVQIERVLGTGDIVTSPDVVQANVTEATGLADGYASPYSTNQPNAEVVTAETQDTIVNLQARTGNPDAAYGYIQAWMFGLDEQGLLDQTPELKRLMNLYEEKGAYAFYVTNAEGKYKVRDADKAYYLNDDGKLLVAIAYTLFDSLNYEGVGTYQTRVNWHSNASLIEADRRIVENPIQYTGDFHVWSYSWKGQVLFYFGTNCGAENCKNYGDKRPAFFVTPEPEPGEPGEPGTGGGQPPVIIVPDKPNQPPVEPIKNPDEDPVKQGNAPVGGGKNDDKGPGKFEQGDHPAKSEGASPNAGNDDGSSKSSNQTQDPSANQDGTTPAVEEIPVTNDTTVTDNGSGETTNTSNEKPNKGKVTLSD